MLLEINIDVDIHVPRDAADFCRVDIAQDVDEYRFLAVDGVRAGVTDPSRLASFWSPLAGTVGIIALIGSFSDPLDSSGFGVTWKSNSLSLGSYNLLGALTLIVIAVLVFFGATGRRQAYIGAAVLGVAAALALHVQLGFSDPFLGGTPVSAAFFLTLAVVAGCLARQSRAG